jgi:hypothetical protein
MTSRKLFLASIAAGVLSVGGLVGSTINASAYVACNRDGDCWHTERRTHAPGIRFDYHPDDWYFHQHWENNNDRHFRDYHEGRGYYRGGVWITL